MPHFFLAQAFCSTFLVSTGDITKAAEDIIYYQSKSTVGFPMIRKLISMCKIGGIPI